MAEYAATALRRIFNDRIWSELHLHYPEKKELSWGGMRYILIFLMFFMSTQAFAEIYRWVDNDGRKNFTDNLMQVPPQYRTAESKPPLPLSNRSFRDGPLVVQSDFNVLYLTERSENLGGLPPCWIV